VDRGRAWGGDLPPSTSTTSKKMLTRMSGALSPWRRLDHWPVLGADWKGRPEARALLRGEREVVGPDGRPVGVAPTGGGVVTVLHSFAMPFIRYSIGDLAVRGLDRCPCGAPWSTLTAIHGRTVDMFRLTEGLSLSCSRFSSLFTTCAGGAAARSIGQPSARCRRNCAALKSTRARRYSRRA